MIAQFNINLKVVINKYKFTYINTRIYTFFFFYKRGQKTNIYKFLPKMTLLTSTAK